MPGAQLINRLKRAWDAATPDERPDRAIMGAVRMVGAGLVMTLIVVLVLTEVHAAIPFETDNSGAYIGPFGEVVSTLESTGVAALSLLVVGFVVVAAGAIMQYFGGGFGGR